MGANAASLILTYIGKYKRVSDSDLILDWGCGCGRVVTQLMKFVSPERLHGCDIDSEAIAWNKQNIRGPNFTCVNPYPPTPYGDGTFDIVYGISVMTHLEEQTQMHWLKELKRITQPGAILALSVMGEKLRTTNMPASLASEFGEKGFVSFVPTYSKLLTGFSHEEYYREAYHSLDYIESNWSRYFDVVEYIETKHQDVVILRAR
jgi:ubiquinone/menaquinone biosynthesis C-methylase UbiE